MSDIPATQRRPLRLLALDGGGIRGYSELIILDEIMSEIAERRNLDVTTIRPCDYFDLIGGTSTGGIIAVLLAKLRLTTKECMTIYGNLSEKVFSEDLLYTSCPVEKMVRSQFDANTLKEVIREELVKWLPDFENGEVMSPEEKADALLVDSSITDDTSTCRAFVCATPGKRPQKGNPVLFRTYNTASNVRIWEALRATSAAPGFFDRIRIGEEDYVDGGLGCNNPAEEVYQEGRNYFKRGEEFPKIGCLVSLGTGMPKTLSAERDEQTDSGGYGIRALLNWLLIKLDLVDKQDVELQTRIATDCETTHRRMLDSTNKLKKKYFRLNVQQGCQDIGLGEYKRLGEVGTHTRVYLATKEAKAKMKDLVDILLKLSSDKPSDWPRD